MSEKEVRGAGILSRVKADELTQVEAAEMLNLSYRQTKRLYRRFVKLAADGLIHGNAGKRSNHSTTAKIRKRVLDLVKKHYGGASGERFGPTLAAEHLAEDHGLVVECGNATALDVGSGSVDARAEAQTVSAKAFEKSHFGTGADGWKLRELAGRTRPARLFTAHGG